MLYSCTKSNKKLITKTPYFKLIDSELFGCTRGRRSKQSGVNMGKGWTWHRSKDHLQVGLMRIWHVSLIINSPPPVLAVGQAKLTYGTVWEYALLKWWGFRPPSSHTRATRQPPFEWGTKAGFECTRAGMCPFLLWTLLAEIHINAHKQFTFA